MQRNACDVNKIGVFCIVCPILNVRGALVPFPQSPSSMAMYNLNHIDPHPHVSFDNCRRRRHVQECWPDKSIS